MEHLPARRTAPLRRAAVAAAAVALALTLVACSSDDEPSAGTTTASTAGPSTTTTTASTTAASPTAAPTTAVATTEPSSSTTTAADGLPTSPAAYATAMIQAWVAGDQAEASRYGTPDAVSTLFGLESGGEEGAPPPTWALDHCEGAAGSSYCSFTAGGSAGVTLRVGNEAVSQGQEHAVTEVRVDG